MKITLHGMSRKLETSYGVAFVELVSDEVDPVKGSYSETHTTDSSDGFSNVWFRVTVPVEIIYC